MEKEFEIEKIVTKSGVFTVKVNDYYLHSKYDPDKEAKQLCEKNFKPNNFHILFGYGLGYFANALFEKMGTYEEMLVIDPLYDLINDGKDSRVTVIKDIEGELFKKIIITKIAKFNRRIHMIQSPNYDKILNNSYKLVLDIINEQAKLNRINENTIRFFAEDWQKNYLFNLYNAVGDKSLFDIKGKYDLPVVIASGGPSLSKQLPLLNTIKDKIIIIAAGSTINTLLSSNIVPDFVVSVDGSLANYNHFKDIHTKQTTYIYSLTSHYGIRESFENPAYLFNSFGKDKMKNHFEKLTSIELPEIAGGGSVANFAFTIATFITTGPIAIIGQDLAYTDNKTHAENNKNHRIIDEEYKKARGMFLTEGYFKDEVLTDYTFLSMKESFEGLLSIVGKDRDIYNCTEGGVNLKGFNKLSFKDFCKIYIKNEPVKKVIPNDNVKHNRTNLLVKMKSELKIYHKIRNNLVESLYILKSNKSDSLFLENTLRNLNKNDEVLKKLIEEVSMISILDPITISIQNNFLPSPNESSKDAYNRVYNQNKELYSRLINALDLTVGYTEELIIKIEKNEVIKNG
ncbi:motility associated factor glycosyltransferase family protein [Psychrobacillus sp. FJAT-21963]|uniref:motility associated factor glycosyltransferase family protein n=1 Tax=Psychrobacillus sp. FJAT-21963 TaxID=1712028 RepID=UPI0006F8B593|nr:6-hydroxymethylpterin diphosphokinase MptE-like protein [Psychrobacillus sp. FJAT-21963]KQL36755.1 hypothetical protein AN959_01415 [Psychrobacillus sp. FJAT-21963]